MVYQSAYSAIRKASRVSDNQFKMEEAIMRVWGTSDDLEDFINEYYEGESRMTEDEVFNVIWGLKEMHDIRVKRLYDVFKRTFQLDEYAPDEIKELREQFFKSLDKDGDCNGR